MYKAFFGLNANPFELSPDPFFMVSSEKSKEALASISVAVGRRKGFVVMTGEVGTGKTLVLRSLFELWEREQIPFAYFIGPRLSTVDFLSYINFELGIKVDVPTKGNLLRALYGFLLAQFEKGLTTVLIIDEAHQIPRSVLEEIRLLTNFETSQQKLIQIILAGQPELDKKLDSPELRSLKQRIAVRCTLEPLRPEEIRNYVERRLVLAGADPETAASIFPVDTVKAIYRYSQGIQRLINNICDQALIAACTCQIRVVPVELIDQIASRFRLEPAPDPKRARTSVSPASQMQAPAPPSSSRAVPAPVVPVATEDRQNEIQQELDIEIEAPAQLDPANESEAASKSDLSDSSTLDQSEPQPQKIDRDESVGATEVPALEAASESRPLPSRFPAGPGSSFLAACQHLIDQAVASATDLRAIAQSDQIATVVAPAATQHDVPSFSQAKSDVPLQEPLSSATEEPSASATFLTTAKSTAVTPPTPDSGAPAVSTTLPEPAKSAPPTAVEATATKPVAPEPEAKSAAARRAIQSAALSTSPESPKSEPLPKPFSPPLALAAAASSANAVTIQQPAYQPAPLAPAHHSPPLPSAEIPKPEPARPQTQPSPPPLSVAAALSYPPPGTPNPAYSPAAPDSSIKLPEFPEPDALSGYIAALRANRKAEYFEKHKGAMQPGSETADELLSPQPSSGEEQLGETDGQTSIRIDRGIFISVIVAGLLILGYAVIRYFGRPSIPGQDAAMAAVAHASSEPTASHPPSQNGATRSITSQAGTKIRGASNGTSDLQTYKQLGEPALAAKKTAPGRPRLAAPTVSPHDATSNANDSATEPVIDTQASSVPELNEALTAIAHPTNPLPAGGNVKPARLLSSVSPLYPPMARNMRVQGDVHIDALVDENGHVSEAKVITGPVLLRQPALEALAHWKYQPATLDGKPVQTHLAITIQFHIQ
jgi:general secretion pathway protein A